ncbi:MAG: transposase, partial [Schwartzia sp.]|nr:transposase [Schwartzia sp. (in: firmicutes)]
MKPHQEELLVKSKDENSLAHTKWNCKYHIVFAPKYRRKVFFAEKRLA